MARIESAITETSTTRRGANAGNVNIPAIAITNSGENLAETSPHRPPSSGAIDNSPTIIDHVKNVAIATETVGTVLTHHRLGDEIKLSKYITMSPMVEGVTTSAIFPNFAPTGCGDKIKAVSMSSNACE